MAFFEDLERRAASINSLLCIGLDPHKEDLDRLEKTVDGNYTRKELLKLFCSAIVSDTKHVACAYKLNSAFFEALGAEGIRSLVEVCTDIIPANIPVILDAKRGDISSTAKAYAAAAFEVIKADCITLHPYMGYDSIQPFIENYEGKGCFVLCKTSNPTAKEFQNMEVNESTKLYEAVADKCTHWDKGMNKIGLVVGATDPDAMQKIRRRAKDIWILAPGVGFQGGDLEDIVCAGLRSDGYGLLVTVSRGVSRAENPREEAERLRNKLNDCRSRQGRSGASIRLKAYQKEFFDLALDCGVLKFGDFTLKSGRKSPFFFNAGNFDTGRAIHVLAECYAESIVDSSVEFDVLFGPAYKGITLASTTAMALSSIYKLNCAFAYNRKEAKNHGEGGKLVGAEVKGKRIIIIDDVITAGTAIRQSMELLRNQGASVVAVFVALDREEKASESSTLSSIQLVEQDFGIKVYSIARLHHLLEYLKGCAELNGSILDSIKAYHDKFGIRSGSSEAP